MNVAIVSPIPIFPVNAGNRSRILNLVRGIRSLGHNVHFVYLESKQTGGMDMGAHRAEFGASQITVLRREGWRLWLYRSKRLAWGLRRVLGRILRSESAWYNGLDELYSHTFSSALRALHVKFNFDAVMVNYVFYSRALDSFPNSVLKIVDTHDIFADRHLPFLASSSGKNYMFSIPPSRECDGLTRAHVAIAIQSEEGNLLAARLASRASPRVTVISHLLNFSALVDCVSDSGATFLGSNSEPNRNAVNFFIGSVLPHITEKCPEFKLHLAGSISDFVSNHANVIKHGIVSDPALVFALAPISLNPMLIGSGVNIKVLESMAMGVPVISTLTGVRGIASAAKPGLFITPDDDAQGFAAVVLELATHARKRIHAGHAARETARKWNEENMSRLSELFARQRIAVDDEECVPYR